MSRLLVSASALVLFFGATASADDFYKGKTVRIVVGFSAGKIFYN